LYSTDEKLLFFILENRKLDIYVHHSRKKTSKIQSDSLKSLETNGWKTIGKA